MSKRESANGYSVPGSFELFYSKGYAMLTVYPPRGSGRPVYTGEVVNRMKMLKIPMVRKLIIDRVVSEASGKPEQLSEWPEGAKLSATLEIYLSEDDMVATCVMHPPKKGGGSYRFEDFVEELQEHGVVYGVDQETVRRMISEEIYERETIIAKGSEPENGTFQSVKYHFNTKPGKPYLVMHYGRINLKELDFIQDRKAGDVLAELVAAVPARDGSTVTGEVLPAVTEGTIEELRPGVNTELSETGDRIIAIEDGNACLKSGEVCIEPVVTVENVDYSTGNIAFDGSVVVKGNVADGFTVKADGTVQVEGFVGKVDIAGRSVLLKNGVNAAGEGRIRSEDDILARYIENTRIECGGNLIVEEAIMHSDIEVDGNVLLSGRRAELLAGRSIIGGSLWCKKLGNLSEVKTFVRIGVEPEAIALSNKLNEVMVQKREELNRADTGLKRLTKRIKGRGLVSEDEAQELKRLNREVQKLVSDLRRLQTHLKKISDALKADSECLLVVEQIMYHGVSIVFGDIEYPVPLKGVRKTIFKVRDDRILESGFNPYEAPKLSFKEPASEQTDIAIE
jgi:uncharacterized protein (DUF342 family)